MPLTCIFGGQCGAMGAPEGSGERRVRSGFIPAHTVLRRFAGRRTGLVGAAGLPSRT